MMSSMYEIPSFLYCKPKNIYCLARGYKGDKIEIEFKNPNNLTNCLLKLFDFRNQELLTLIPNSQQVTISGEVSNTLNRGIYPTEIIGYDSEENLVTLYNKLNYFIEVL